MKRAFVAPCVLFNIDVNGTTFLAASVFNFFHF